jgi:hypothetical protein
MKKRTVITTEKHEIWVVREGSRDPDRENEPDAITLNPDDETEDSEAGETSRGHHD